MGRIASLNDDNLSDEERRELEELSRLAQVGAGLMKRDDIPVEKAPTPRRRQARTPERTVDEYKKQNQADEQTPLMTLLGYSQLAGQFNEDPDVSTAAMQLSGQIGRINQLLAIKRTCGKWTPQEERDYIHCMGKVLFHLSSLCEHTLVSLQRVAEISLTEMESEKIKRLHTGK